MTCLFLFEIYNPFTFEPLSIYDFSFTKTSVIYHRADDRSALEHHPMDIVWDISPLFFPA